MQIWESINISLLASNLLKKPGTGVYLVVFISIIVIIRHVKTPFKIQLRSSDTEQQIAYEIKDMISISQSSRYEAKLIMEGYDEWHRSICKDPECPYCIIGTSIVKKCEHLFLCGLSK